MIWARLGRQTLVLSKVLFRAPLLTGWAPDIQCSLICHRGQKGAQLPLLATVAVVRRLTTGSQPCEAFHPISRLAP